MIIDAYRIELLEPRQLGVGAGMSQYGWRIGSAGAASLALVVAARADWSMAYYTCALLALPAMLVGVVMGEPVRRRPPAPVPGVLQAIVAYFSPLTEFLKREGAVVVLLFVLIHKVGDTLANLTLRLLFDDLGYTNDEIAFYDVFVGFIAFLVGIFVGGALYARARHEARGARQPGADGGIQLQLRGAGSRRAFEPRHGWRDRLREFRERHRRRHRGGVSLGAVQPAIHGDAVRLALGAGEHRGPVPHRHDRRRAHRRDGLRELLPADHGDCGPRGGPVLVHDSVGARGPLDRVSWQGNRGLTHHSLRTPAFADRSVSAKASARLAVAAFGSEGGRFARSKQFVQTKVPVSDSSYQHLNPSNPQPSLRRPTPPVIIELQYQT